MKIKHYIALGAVLAAAVAASIPIVLLGGSGKPEPAAQPEYARSLQGLVDEARPPGEARMFIKGCVAGPTANAHFCAWIYRAKCHAAMVVVTPGEGTVPTAQGVADLEPKDCTPVNVLHWLGSQTSK